MQVDKAHAEEKLRAAKPALEEAERALNTIKPAHIATVRKLGKPPHLIMRIMDSVLLLFQRRIGPGTQDPERDSPTPSWGWITQGTATNDWFIRALIAIV